jgi:hypothetical protein
LFGESSEPTAWLAGEIRRVLSADNTAARGMWANLTASARFSMPNPSIYGRF